MPTPRAASTKAVAKPRERATAKVPTRARILAAAEALFASHGFDGVTMPAIAAASGITAGAIYKHFTSKAALFFEVVRRAVEAAPASAGGESLPEAVASYTTRRLKRVRQMAVEVHYAAARNPEVRRMLRGALDRQIGEIGEAVAAAQRSGALSADADPELAATAVMAFIMGLMHMETLAPKLVGDARWRDFVRDRAAALLGYE
jgi:TetR/AcrR family acrAB operon transcriptional repressor